MEQVTIGIDEAGRGSLFSMIVACAVVQDDRLCVQSKDIVIRDSKKMTPLQRKRTQTFLEQNSRFGIGSCDEKEIDSQGISWCNMTAMHRAIDNLREKYPGLQITKILVDGNRFTPYENIPHELIVQGDGSVPVISCASILAKTTRDQWVTGLCATHKTELEKYGISQNKGYGTKKHIEAIQTHGPHPLHRQTFLKKLAKQRPKPLTAL